MLSRAVRIAICAVAAFLAFGGWPPERVSAAARAPQPALDNLGPFTPASQAASVVYGQPRSAAGGLIPSSERDPDGSATDQWAWDGFTLNATHAITEIRWSGGYDPARFGSGGPVANFTVNIYASIPANTQPDLSGPPLVHYQVGGNAGETAGPVLGGVQMYDYQFVLPVPFQATGGTKYWVQIVAFQPGAPDLGLTKAASGDGQYFRKRASEFTYEIVTGDTSFSLLAATMNGPMMYLPMLVKWGSAK